MNLAKYKKEFEKKFISSWVFTKDPHPLWRDECPSPEKVWSFITHTLESERKHAYQKGYTKGRVETAKAMMALNELEKKVKQL